MAELDYQRIARAIDAAVNGNAKPKKIAFVLLLFEVGQASGRRVNYVSNGDRTNMIVAVKEWLARAEGRHAETETVQ